MIPTGQGAYLKTLLRDESLSRIVPESLKNRRQGTWDKPAVSNLNIPGPNNAAPRVGAHRLV